MHTNTRKTWLVLLSVAALAGAGRVVYLAWLPQEESSGAAGFASVDHANRLSTGRASGMQWDRDEAELARLYARCPTAAAIDLATAIESPERVEPLLPPVRRTSARVPYPTTGMPPVAGPVASSQPAAGPGLRLASRPVPRIVYPQAVRATPPAGVQALEGPSLQPQVASGPRIAALPQGQEVPQRASAGEWLIDPDRWYTPEERAAGQEPAEPTVEYPAAEKPIVEEPAIEEPIAESPPADEPPAAEPPVEQQPLPANEPGAAEAEGWELEEPEFAAEPQGAAGDSPLVVPPQAVSTPPAEGALFAPPAGETMPPNAVSAESVPSPTEPPARTDLFTAPVERLPSPPSASSPSSGQPFAPPPGPGASMGAVDPHMELFAKNAYPSARECATCHEEIYEQWSVSAHAYAAVSPMFQKFDQKINDLAQGTIGYFCMRCHAPVATSLCASRDEPLWNLPEVAREGVTCIACHRVQYIYGKANGERRIEPGDIFAPVFGGIGGDGVAAAIRGKEHFKVKTSPGEAGPGQDIHVAGVYFDQLTRSEFCASCHQVAVHPGIKLEVVYEQYRASPACQKGIQCQDCHMGRVPGLPLGYECGPVAKMADRSVNDRRKKSNHIFYGPNYSIAHPGVFPLNLKADRWTMDQWLLFDWRAGWGTDEFEDRVAEGGIQVCFPPVWAEADDRYDAREIIEANLKKLDHKREIRREIMENGSHVAGPYFDAAPCRGQDLRFHYVVTNTNEGHNLLTASLGAQPQLWANVVLIGPDGRRLWETGYTDSYGDLANIHSEDVRHGRVPFDWQLFNLQSMFLITGVKGTDREFYLPVNVDIDQLPFIRPGAQPISTINHPPFIRMESQSLSALGSRKVPYRVPGELLRQPGPYRLALRMRSRAEPPYFVRFVGGTAEMQRRMIEETIDVHPTSVEFYVR